MCPARLCVGLFISNPFPIGIGREHISFTCLFSQQEKWERET